MTSDGLKATVSENVEFYESDDEDDEEEEDVNIPQGAINAFLGYDTGDVGEKLAGNVTLTNDQIYGEMKERVLDTAGGFVELVGSEEDGDDIRQEETAETLCRSDNGTGFRLDGRRGSFARTRCTLAQ